MHDHVTKTYAMLQHDDRSPQKGIEVSRIPGC